MLRIAPILILLVGLVPTSTAHAEAPAPDPAVRGEFIAMAEQKYKLEPDTVRAWLARAEHRPSIVAAMSRPAEGVKSWKDYRPIFLGERRIREGREFLAAHRAQLAKVESDTGVPAEVIVAIIGVETSYGQITGSYRVLDALYTLGFFYPISGKPEKVEHEARRSAFFRDQLAQAMLLAKENNFDLDSLKGSYAGAMGWGQFMPSSYRAYARDGNGDGRIDLFASVPDIFASVANYFVAHGWQRGEPVVERAAAAADAPALPAGKLEASYTLADLGKRGYRPNQALGRDLRANLIVLEGMDGTEHWLGFPNFYVITRYNISSMYAMAVHQLSREIAADKAPTAAP